MTLLDETRSELGSVTAQPLVMNPTSRRWVAAGGSFEASVMDLSGRETIALGRSVDTEVVRMYCDFNASGIPPLGVKARVRVEGKDWQVLGVRRIPKEQDEAGAVYELERTT